MIRRGPIKVGIVAAAVIAATCFSVRPAQADFGISIGGRRGGVSIYTGNGYHSYPSYGYRAYPSYGYRSYYSSPVVPQIYYGRPNYYYSRPSYYGSPVYRYYTPYRHDYRGHHHHHHSDHHHHGHHGGHR